MAFSLKLRTEIVNQVRHGMTVTEASRMYNVARSTISNWLESPEVYLSESRTVHQPYDLEDKLDVLRMAEQGDLTAKQIAEIKNIEYHTINHWIKDKNRILAVYSSQWKCATNYEIPKSPEEEAESVGKSCSKDTKRHIKDLKDENELLKAKVAFLEELMELNGTPVSSFKKKRNTKQSTESSKEE